MGGGGGGGGQYTSNFLLDWKTLDNKDLNYIKVTSCCENMASVGVPIIAGSKNLVQVLVTELVTEGFPFRLAV